MFKRVFIPLKTFWKTSALDQSFHRSSPGHCLFRCLMIPAWNLPSIFKQLICLVLSFLGEPSVHCSLQSTDLNERLNLTLTESLQTINTLKKASSYRNVHNASQDETLEVMLSALQVKFSLGFESFLTLLNPKLKQRVKYIQLKSHEFASLMNYDRPEDMSLSFSPFRFTPVVC